MSLLNEIKKVWEGPAGKGYWGNWCWKLLHMCPNCMNKVPIRQAGWIGGTGIKGLCCKSCEKKVAWEEWMNLPRKALWMYIGSVKGD